MKKQKDERRPNPAATRLLLDPTYLVQELRVVAQEQRVAGLLVDHPLVLRVQRGGLLVPRRHLLLHTLHLGSRSLRLLIGLVGAGGEEAGRDAVDPEAPGQEQRHLRVVRLRRALLLILQQQEDVRLVVARLLLGRQRCGAAVLAEGVVDGEGQLGVEAAGGGFAAGAAWGGSGGRRGGEDVAVGEGSAELQGGRGR